MTKIILIGLAVYFALLASVILLAPHMFYEMAPGVSDHGPFNGHFTRDVGLAFLVSAGGLLTGALQADNRLALFGTGFPALHGAYHIILWLAEGAHTHATALSDLAGTAGIAGLALLMAARLKGGAT